MPEQSPEDAQNHNAPWLAIAVIVLLLGVAVAAVLGTSEAPGPTAKPETVQHVQADLGDWQPFVDLGQPGDTDGPDGAADAAEVD